MKELIVTLFLLLMFTFFTTIIKVNKIGLFKEKTTNIIQMVTIEEDGKA